MLREREVINQFVNSITSINFASLSIELRMIDIVEETLMFWCEVFDNCWIDVGLVMAHVDVIVGAKNGNAGGVGVLPKVGGMPYCFGKNHQRSGGTTITFPQARISTIYTG